MKDILKNLSKQYQNHYISLADIDKLKQQYQGKITDKQLKNLYKENNKHYLEREEYQTKELLDHVKGYPLDKEQREVVLRDE